MSNSVAASKAMFEPKSNEAPTVLKTKTKMVNPFE